MTQPKLKDDLWAHGQGVDRVPWRGCLGPLRPNIALRALITRFTDNSRFKSEQVSIIFPLISMYASTGWQGRVVPLCCIQVGRVRKHSDWRDFTSIGPSSLLPSRIWNGHLTVCSWPVPALLPLLFNFYIKKPTTYFLAIITSDLFLKIAITEPHSWEAIITSSYAMPEKAISIRLHRMHFPMEKIQRFQSLLP